MKAVDTNLLVRFLVDDDEAQAARVNELFEQAEAGGGRFLVTVPVVLELIWVLSAVYDFSREDVLDALDLLIRLAVLEFEQHDRIVELLHLGKTTPLDLPDLLIGLAGRSAGAEVTLTFDQGLRETGLFERL